MAQSRFCDNHMDTLNNKDRSAYTVALESIQTLLQTSVFCRFNCKWIYKLCPPGFGQFILFFPAEPLKLRLIGWEASVIIIFRSTQMLCGVYIFWLEVLKDSQRLVLKPFLHHLGCMLWVIFMVKGEPLPQSFVTCTLSYFRPVSLPLPLGNPTKHDIAITMLLYRDGIS